MPDIETIERNQDAVYWAWSGKDIQGTPTVSTGIALRVRWEEKQSQMLDSQGRTISVDAQVVVNREVLVESIMWLGKLGALSGTPPTPTSKIFQIAAYDRVPDIDNSYTRRTVGLRRYHDTMPSIV